VFFVKLMVVFYEKLVGDLLLVLLDKVLKNKPHGNPMQTARFYFKLFFGFHSKCLAGQVATGDENAVGMPTGVAMFA
jgi:hypothetical protein